jgi:hypothetical protein
VVTRPTTPMRRLPDFLIIGAQRCGTTSLYRYLCAHPAVAPAVLNKGIHFFDTNFDRGVGWYRSNFPTEATLAWRARRSGSDRVITGEGSPYYVFHPLGPERIARALPGVRAILMLRDPVSRAYSQHQHERARGFESLGFEEALEAEEGRLAGEEDRMRQDPTYRSFSHQHHSYVARGMYAAQIRRWLEHFDVDELLVVDSAAFFADPDDEYRRVLRFLGLQERSLPEYRPLNAHRYDRMSDRARGFLVERFREPDRELIELGYRFPWAEADG